MLFLPLLNYFQALQLYSSSDCIIEKSETFTNSIIAKLRCDARTEENNKRVAQFLFPWVSKAIISF